MRLQRRTLAVASATAVLTSTAVFAVTGPASADLPSRDPGMARMHELVREGNPGMGRMHELMPDGNPGMMRMRERMKTGSGTHGMHSH